VNQFHLLGRASCGERESIFLLKFCEESMAAESSGGGSLLLHRTLLFFFFIQQMQVRLRDLSMGKRNHGWRKRL